MCFLCRLARLLMDVVTQRMPVRCGLLLVPAAAVERLKSEGIWAKLLTENTGNIWNNPARCSYRVNLTTRLSSLRGLQGTEPAFTYLPLCGTVSALAQRL